MIYMLTNDWSERVFTEFTTSDRALPYGIDTAATPWHNDPVKTEYSQINPDDERGRDLLNGAPKGTISQATGTVL